MTYRVHYCYLTFSVKELCSKYSLTAEEFVETWVAYSTNKHFSLKPVEGDLSTFENEVK